MDVVSSGPFRVAELRWFLSNGAPALTVVCKATFTLRPGESPLAEQQDDPNEEDTYWDDDPQRSLSASTDLMPFKARADVVLSGSVYAPKPVRALVARLRIGSVDKAIEVHTDRAFGADGALREGMPFAKMRLRYERAAGGPDTANPVGMRFDVQDPRGNSALPNLQPVGIQIVRRGEVFEPIGFGPIALTWRDRAHKAQRSVPGWSPYGFSQRPLPEGLDASFFNVAPADQQLDKLGPGALLTLENLHPEHAQMSTRIVGPEPQARVERGTAAPQMLSLVCDTLSIDTDRGVCHLVWRGTVQLSHPQEPIRIVVSAAESAAGWSKSESFDEAADRTMSPMHISQVGPAMMPFSQRSAAADRPPPPRPSAPSSGLPFQREGFAQSPPPVKAPPKPPPRRAATMPMPPGSAGAPSSQSLPFAPSQGQSEGTQVYELPQHLAGQAPLPLPIPPPAPPPPPPGPPPPPAVPPPAQTQVSAHQEASPWASAPNSAPAQAAPSRGSIGERFLSEPQGAAVEERRPPSRGEPESLGAVARSVDSAAPAFVAGAAVAGVVAASNAAADPLPPPRVAGPGRAKTRQHVSEAVDLLWFDGESVGRIRRRPPWRALLTDLESSHEVEPEESALGNTPEEIEDRRDVLHVLVHGSAVDEYGIAEALEQAVRADGKIINPLVLTTGQLAFAFDELEMLKATLSTAMPFAQGDDALTAATSSAKDFLSTPGLLATGTVIDSLTIRIREAFARVKRPVATDYLTVQSERALLEKRHYQKREVFSNTHLRGMFFPPGSDNPIPLYLPEEVSKKLPLYQRFSVRAIVEVHRTADQNEVHSAALRCLALGRTVAPNR